MNPTTPRPSVVFQGRVAFLTATDEERDALSVTEERVALDELCINTIRTLSMDAVQKANSGHPGTPMALAPLAYVLYTRDMRHDPSSPTGRTATASCCPRGHASMLLYSMLHLTGYDLSLDDLKKFRQSARPTAGHPEYGHAPGVETTTGPLGQGIANAVGMASAERMLARALQPPGHGPRRSLHVRRSSPTATSMEGVSARGSVARRPPRARQPDRLLRRQPHHDRGRHGARLLRGRRQALRGLRLARAEPRRGHRTRAACRRLIEAAQQETDRPRMIIVRTHIAHGSPNKQDTHEAHGAPLGEEEIRAHQAGLRLARARSRSSSPDECLARVPRERRPRREHYEEWKERFEASEQHESCSASSSAGSPRAGTPRCPRRGPTRADRDAQASNEVIQWIARARAPSSSAARPISRRPRSR